MTKALVFSGGGAVGVAWEIGVAAGLAQGGVDLRNANFITGTSAGAVVGARIAIGQDFELLVAFYREMGRQQAADPAPRSAPTDEQMAKLMGKIADMLAGEGPPEPRRAELGRFASASQAAPEESLISAFADLKDVAWPPSFRCPTIDAETGEWVVWDSTSGVALDRGIASSCCVPGLVAPITVNGRRYIDGGFRSPTSADLAKGHDRVLIVSLVSEYTQSGPFARMGFRSQLESEIQHLRDNGSEVLVFETDASSMKALGANPMDSTAAPAALEAGIRQGEAEASRIGAFWNRQ